MVKGKFLNLCTISPRGGTKIIVTGAVVSKNIITDNGRMSASKLVGQLSIKSIKFYHQQAAIVIISV